MKISKIRDVKTPTRANPTDAGIDFFVPNDQETIGLKPGESAFIPSGIKVNCPEGYALQIIQAGDKIVQFVLLPLGDPTVELVDENNLYESVSSRGEGGFGSSGTK